MITFESAVKVIPYAQEQVYNKLSDLNNLESFKGSLPEEKVKDLSFDTDTLSFNVTGVGQLTLQIIEREPFSSIKFETTNSPLPFNLTVQLVGTTNEACQLKLVVAMELNPFMKGMIQKPLQEGLEKMAETLTMIQY